MPTGDKTHFVQTNPNNQSGARVYQSVQNIISVTDNQDTPSTATVTMADGTSFTLPGYTAQDFVDRVNGIWG